ncbi:MAG: eukaryotic-like serine/threonine-protein kinase [Solirubrobacterales bacterium]|jgi:serine/threonine-protein kinase|nr:eukaryotic-like serine/threonine-protein kinase [Solirubrobacterales bacterium]
MASARKGTMVDERYRLVRKIGSGGMADVWLADDIELDRQVAIKILHEHFSQDKEFVERFRREASSAAGLQHPNVVGVFDRGEFRNSYFIAMEYVEGDSLKDLINQGMTVAAAVEVTRQILEAERFAHKKGIIHRDIKPHNVMIDGDGRARVADFGIARAGSSEITQTGSVMGTAQYLSPEQAQGKEVTAQSDLYSTGVVLYEALTGEVPFEADSPVAVALKQVQEVPRRPSSINPDVPPALDAVVMRSLAKQPEQRFADAAAFIKALDEAERKPDTPRRQDTAAYAAVNTEGDYTDVRYPEEEAAYGPPPRRSIWRWIVVALLVSLVAGAVAYALTRPDKADVPSVTGQSLASATAVLKAHGFDVNTTLVPNLAARDTVLEQDPTAGSNVDKGSTITLSVSTGPGTVEIPDVQGLTPKDAKKKLEDAGFQVTSREGFSADVAKGLVFGTEPAVGTGVQTGQTVTLLISKGANTVTVPGVIGLTQEAATARIQQAGLTAIPQQRQDPSPPGKVVAQSPTAGQDLKKGGTVTIFVSTGTLQVPNVVGETKQAAVTALKRAGFKPVVSLDTSAPPESAGLVVDQFPLAGSAATRGSTVQISVGAPPTTPTTTTP